MTGYLPSRRRLITGGLALAAATVIAPRAGRAAAPALARLLDDARHLTGLHTLIVAQAGKVLAERVYRGPPATRPVNVKSLSKSIIALLTGIAIDRGVLTGTGQKVADLLPADLPDDPDPRLDRLTIGHLLSMQAGLERTSGPYYGAWVESRNWVRTALSRPFVAEPGGRMLYSTGNSHLLSAILTRTSGESTLALARDWLGDPLDITIPPWTRDPQGIYMGGNQMALSPRALLAIGEMLCRGGVAADGTRLVSEGWIREMWTPRTTSPFTGDAYGYGWFLRETGARPAVYGWGYGGQLLYLLPGIDMVVVITSDPDTPSGRTGYVDELHGLVAGIVRTAT
ncbi:serine hydrolase (plasmid) [Tistrella mobilis]|uniref:6-aminohexanoate hydrolase n=1 Tax=Tistrella mobilis TaxID=171437 RepID=A0A162KYF5_9PROT|nr:serine hydrolase [Tistrella mobilis]KYO52450.1 6-aminohexanoate hydrolase [Tistrella mobilis]